MNEKRATANPVGAPARIFHLARSRVCVCVLAWQGTEILGRAAAGAGRSKRVAFRRPHIQVLRLYPGGRVGIE